MKLLRFDTSSHLYTLAKNNNNKMKLYDRINRFDLTQINPKILFTQRIYDGLNEQIFGVEMRSMDCIQCLPIHI